MARPLKLTLEQAEEIRRLLQEGTTVSALARRFEVDRHTIRRIRNHMFYKVKPEEIMWSDALREYEEDY